MNEQQVKNIVADVLTDLATRFRELAWPLTVEHYLSVAATLREPKPEPKPEMVEQIIFTPTGERRSPKTGEGYCSAGRYRTWTGGLDCEANYLIFIRTTKMVPAPVADYGKLH